MLTPQALFALTYIPAVTLFVFSIVAGMNNNFKVKKLYGFCSIISFVIAVIAYIFFLYLFQFRIFF